MVRWVVVVVCSSSNSNNGEKVDICSSKNELSSKKKFLFSFFVRIFFVLSSISFLEMLSSASFVFWEWIFPDRWFGPILSRLFYFCFYLVIFSKAGQYRPYILVVLGKMGVLFSRENARRKYWDTGLQDIFVFLLK